MAAAQITITNRTVNPIQVPGSPLGIPLAAAPAFRDVPVDAILAAPYYQTQLAAMVTAGTIYVAFLGTNLTAQQVEDLEVTIGTLQEATDAEVLAIVGDRVYTDDPILTTAQTVTDSAKALSGAIGDRVYTADPILTSDQTVTASALALSGAIDDLSDAVGDRVYTGSILTSAQTVTASAQALSNAIPVVPTQAQEVITTETITGADTALADTLSAAPKSVASVQLFLDGLLKVQGAGADYTLGGTGNRTITWLANTGTAPDITSANVLVAVYLT